MVQDNLRKKQSLLAATVLTCILVFIAMFFLYQRALSQVNEGINAVQSQIAAMFTDNEMIANAIAVGYQQLRRFELCDGENIFHSRDKVWGINADSTTINPELGALVTRKKEYTTQCIYKVAEYIREDIHRLNPGLQNIHRYIVAKDGNWFYWFIGNDSLSFSFNTSEMARSPQSFFAEPEKFYDRLLQKNILKKSQSATKFYYDQITKDKGYSVASYIYDLYDLPTGKVDNNIIGYLVYDLSRTELRSILSNAFNWQVPEALVLGFQSRDTKEILCLTNNCQWLKNSHIYQMSYRYNIKYVLPIWLFMIHDFGALTIFATAPFLIILLFFFIRHRLNQNDKRLYLDPLTDCFTRNILDIIQQRSQSSMLVILFDCNKFKEINDNWGHQAGDQALQIISRCMLDDVRKNSDWVIRTGGDEFIILLNRTNIAHAHIVAERIAAKVAMYSFIVKGQAVPLSVSWGVAACKDSLDTAIQQADANMYQMKRKMKGEG